MTAFVVQATGSTWAHWSAQMALSLAAYGNVPIMPDPAHWRTWGDIVSGFPALAAVNAPRPGGYTDWQDWVRAFNLALRVLE